MKYRRFTPSADLMPWVDCYWSLEDGRTGGVDSIFPDGCCEIVFHLNGRFRREGGQIQPFALVSGQIDAPLALQIGGPSRIFAIRFTPTGARDVTGVPQQAIRGQFPTVADLWSADSDELEERMAEAATDEQRAGVAEQFLYRRLRGRQPHWLQLAVGRIVRSGGRLSVTRLALDAGVSERQIERLFQDRVGLPPKTFAGIIRFQQAYSMARRGSAWVDIAAECGYFDQAHLIRDFRRYTGVTPSFTPTGHGLGVVLASH